MLEPWLSHIDSQVGKIASSELNVIVVGDEEAKQLQLSLRIHEFSRLHRSVFLHVAPPFDELACFGELLSGDSVPGNRDGLRSFQGTIFVSRAAQLSSVQQRLLLRLLEQRESGGGLRLDFRIIAGDNGDLPESVRDGSFRHDLYYRLNEVVVRVPVTLARTKNLARNRAEKRAIEKVLLRTCGDLPQTAELLHLSQPSLDQKIRGLGIAVSDLSISGEDGEINQGGL